MQKDKKKAPTGGRGTRSKPKAKKKDPKARQAEKDKAMDNIIPYKKSVTAGRRLTEAESREKRIYSVSRKKLLRLLKDRIDRKKAKKERSRHSKGELKILRKLDEFKVALDKEEEEIIKLEKQLPEKEKELKDLVNKIKNARIEITKLLEKKKTDDERKLANLVKIIESVKPVETATLLENVDQSLFIEIAKGLKPKTYAKTLKHMSRDKATKLNEKFIAKDD